MSPLSNSLFASQLFATSIFSGIDSIPQKSPIETKPYLWHGQPLLCSLSRLASESSLTRDILHSHVAPSHGEILYLVPRPPVGNKQFDDPAIYKVPRLIWNKFAGKFNRNSTFHQHWCAWSGFRSGFFQSILRGFELDTIRARWKFEIARQDVELEGRTAFLDCFLEVYWHHCLRDLFLADNLKTFVKLGIEKMGSNFWQLCVEKGHTFFRFLQFLNKKITNRWRVMDCKDILLEIRFNSKNMTMIIGIENFVSSFLFSDFHSLIVVSHTSFIFHVIRLLHTRRNYRNTYKKFLIFHKREQVMQPGKRIILHVKINGKK